MASFEELVKRALSDPAPNMAGAPTMASTSTPAPAPAAATPLAPKRKRKKKEMPGWVAPAAIGLGALGIGGAAYLASRGAGRAAAREAAEAAGSRARRGPKFNFKAEPGWEWDFGGKAGKGSYADYKKARDTHWAAEEAARGAERAARDAKWGAERARAKARQAEYEARRQARQGAGQGAGAGAGWGHQQQAGAGAGGGYQRTGGYRYTDPFGSSEKQKAYDYFGFKPGADMEDLKKAYKKLMMKHHPDRPGGNRDKAAEINAMWDLIKNGSMLVKMAYNLGIVWC